MRKPVSVWRLWEVLGFRRTRKQKSRIRRAGRHLEFQPLEEKALLAVVSVDSNAYVSEGSYTVLDFHRDSTQGDLTAYFYTMNSTAEYEDYYLMPDYSVTFYDGFDSASTYINANYDTDADNEDFSVQLSYGMDYTIDPGASTAWVTITDSDSGGPTPNIWLDTSMVTVDEGNSAELIFRRDTTVGDLTVNFQTNNVTAETDDYYVMSGGWVTFWNGYDSVSDWLSAYDDVDGDDEQLSIDVLPSADYNIMGGATVTIEDHEPPVATNNDYFTLEDTPLMGNVLTDDTGQGVDFDPNGDSLYVDPFPMGTPYYGTVTLSVDGSFTYTPVSNYCGYDSFGYYVHDNEGGYAYGTVTITMNPVNDPPVAYDADYSTSEDMPAYGSISYDDVDGDALTVSIAAGGNPQYGDVQFTDYGSYSYFTYTPYDNFHGQDSFTYKVTDPWQATDTGTVLLTVDSVNDDPLAVADAAFTEANQSLTIANLLLNDSDVDGDLLTLSSVDSYSANMATITNNGDGTVLYMPPLDFTGSDSFTYYVTDNMGGYASGTVTVTVTDGPMVWMDTQPVTIAESSSAPITLHRNRSEGDLIVTLYAYGMSAEADDYWVGSTAWFTDGQMEVDIWPFAYDDDDPDDEVLYVGIMDAGSYAIDYSRSMAQVTIEDDDLPVLSLQATGDQYYTNIDISRNTSEGDTTVFFRVVGDTEGYDVSAGSTTATDGSTIYFTTMYTGSYATPVTLYAVDGDRNDDALTVEVVAVQDGTYVPDPSAPLSLDASLIPLASLAMNAPVAVDKLFLIDPQTNTASGNVIHDDTGTGTDSDVDGNALSVLTYTSPADGYLYVSPDGDFTFTAGAGSPAITTFTYTLVDSTGMTTLGLVTIYGNPLSGLKVSVNDATVAEPQARWLDGIGPLLETTATFTVEIDEPASEMLTFSYNTENGTADQLFDYQENSGTVTIQAGNTRADEDIVVTIYGDLLDEGVEYYRVNVTGINNAGSAQATGYILDEPLTSKNKTTCECICACSLGEVNAIVDQLYGMVELVVDLGIADAWLVYRSYQNPHPILEADYTFRAGEAASSITAAMEFGGLEGQAVTYDTSNIQEGEATRIALQADATSLETGHYSYTTEVTAEGPNGSYKHRFEGSHETFNRSESAAGNRWDINGVAKLIEGSGESGKMLDRGEGTAGWFPEDSESSKYATPYGSFSNLTKNPDNTFTLSYPSGDREEFDGLGRLTSRIDSNGNATTYAYTDADGDGLAYEVTSITDPFGRITAYAYTAGLLSSVTDYAGRTTVVEHTGNRLTRIIKPDPDGPAGPELPPELTFEYSADGLMTAVIDDNGNRTELEYGSHLRVGAGTKADGTNWSLDPINVQGWAAPGIPVAATKASDVYASYINERGFETRSTTDRFGLTTSRLDALGNLYQWQRDKHGRILSHTEPDPDGSGGTLGQLVTSYQRDANGNPTTITFADATFVTYEYDPNFSRVTEFTDELGRVTLFDIDPNNGNVLSATQVFGGEVDSEPGSTETDDVTTAFTYTDGLGTLPAGLLLTETDPLGRVTGYNYEDDPAAADFGWLTSVTYATGTADEATVQFEYDAAGNMTAYIDELGRRTDFVYDNLDRPTKVTEPLAEHVLPDGTTSTFRAETSYQYDGEDNLRFLTDPLGNVTEYQYDPRNRLVAVIEADPDGAGPQQSPTTVFTYDGTSNLTSVTDPLGRTTEYAYDELSRLIQVTLPDPDGPLFPDPSPVVSYSYDNVGNLASVTDALGNVTRYRYDERHRLVELTEENPETQGAGGGPVWSYEYDDAGQLIQLTDPLGRVTDYDYDKLGRLVQVTYPDIDGNPATDDRPQFTYAYDKAGNLDFVTDALNNVTVYGYDFRDRLVTITEPDPDGPAGQASSPITSFQYDDANRLTHVIDPLSRVTQYQYDGLNRLITTIYPDADGDPLTVGDRPQTSYAYDAIGNQLSMTDALGNVTTYEYDNLYRLIKLAEPDPDGALGPDPSPVTTVQYDVASQILSVTDPLNRATSYEYDNLGRLAKEVHSDPLTGNAGAESPFTVYRYDLAGNLLSQTDALGHATSYAYDNLYRTASETDANGDAVTFTYDAVGNLLTLTDPPTAGNPTGNTTTWVYDGLDRVTEERNDVGDSRFFVYDLMNNLVQRTDRNGRVIEFDYDQLYRRTAERWLDATETTIHTIGYTYDEADQMLSAGDVFADYGYGYDGLGRVTQVIHDIAGLTPVIEMNQQFDLMNNRTQLGATIGGTADFVNDYGYDHLHRMTGIQQHGVAGGHAVSEKWIDLAYDLAGQFDSITRYADLSATQLVAQSDFTFDLTGRLTDLTHTGVVAGTLDLVNPLADYDWTFDVANRVTQFVSLADGTVDYNYDNRDQVTAADYDYQTDEDYQYDENGNRLSYSSTLTGGGQEGVVTGDLNRLLDDGTYTYVYDAEGNRTARFVDVDDDGDLSAGDTSVTLYGWDHRNRLVTVTTYDDDPEENPQASKLKEVTHIYDTYNRWIGRKVDADGDGAVDTETFFVYDGNQIVLQFDGSQAADLSHRYLWGPIVDQILADETMTDLGQAGDVLWPLTDNLGTVRDIYTYDDAADDVVQRKHIVYDAFGNVTDEEYWDSNEDSITSTHAEAVDQLFKYTGRAFDEETGLQNNLNRWFDPTVGRWLSEDPIGFSAGDANVYRYVGNFSTGAVDPSGLEIDGISQEGTIVYGDGAVLNKIKDAIPHARVKDELPERREYKGNKHFRRVARGSTEYNCLGMVLLKQEFIAPPKQVKVNERMAWWEDKLLKAGFRRVEGAPEKAADRVLGSLKVAIYTGTNELNPQSQPIHITIQDGEGGWLSKMGGHPLYWHDNLKCIEELKNDFHWKVVRVYEIDRNTWLNKKIQHGDRK